MEDVYRIIEALQHVMEDLDELLETLELADRQKLEDERELDKLRQALKQVQRPRDVLQRNPPSSPVRSARATQAPAPAPAPESSHSAEDDAREDDRENPAH